MLTAIFCSLFVVVALTVAVAMSPLLASVDLRVRHFAVTHHYPPLTTFARSAVRLGSASVAVPVVALAASWRAVVVRGVRPLAAVAGALFLVAATTLMLKTVVGRASPSFGAAPEVGVGGSSYPSGHAALATACWTMTALLVARQGSTAARLAVGAAALVSAAVGLGMVYGPGHWLSDVVAGWAIGLAAALVVQVVLAHRTGQGVIRGADRTERTTSPVPDI